MRSNGPLQPALHDHSPAPSPDAVLRSGLAQTPSHPPLFTGSLAAIERGDTGTTFLSVYRSLLAQIEQWCTPTGGPLLHIIRWHALRDYVEVYSHTYPRQPAYPFPPRFGPYAAYLDGFDAIVAAIDAWCEWLSGRFLPGVVPIDLLRSALDDWEESRRTSATCHTSALPYKTPKGTSMLDMFGNA